jgi:hypothetical protein
MDLVRIQIMAGPALIPHEILDYLGSGSAYNEVGVRSVTLPGWTENLNFMASFFETQVCLHLSDKISRDTVPFRF